MLSKTWMFAICFALLVFSFPQINVYASDLNQEPITAFLGNHSRPNMPFVGTDYAVYDPSVTYEGHPSIRDIDGGYTGEVDGAWISVKPNDHIIMGVWVKTESLTTPQDLQAGALLGFDFYSHTNLGFGIIGSMFDMQAGHPTGEEQRYGHPTEFGYTINGANGLEQVSGLICRVPFGQNWTLIKYDFIVPSYYYNYTWATYPQSGKEGVLVEPVQIDSIVPIFVVKDSAHAWFSQPFLYVNPSSAVSDHAPLTAENASPNTDQIVWWNRLYLLIAAVMFIGLAAAFVKIRSITKKSNLVY